MHMTDRACRRLVVIHTENEARMIPLLEYAETESNRGPALKRLGHWGVLACRMARDRPHALLNAGLQPCVE